MEGGGLGSWWETEGETWVEEFASPEEFVDITEILRFRYVCGLVWVGSGVVVVMTVVKKVAGRL